MVFSRDYNRYLTLYQGDIDWYLTKDQIEHLGRLLATIQQGRISDGKKDNTYVVVNIDEPYAEVVWKLIEIGENNPEGLKVLLNNLETELLGYD